MSNKYKKPFLPFKPNIVCNFIHKRQNLVLGTFGIKTLDTCFIYKRQFLQYKAIVNKVLKTYNKLQLLNNNNRLNILHNTNISKASLKVHIFPIFPITEKGQGSRMGKGKGNISNHYFPLKKGFVFFELINVPLLIAQKCFIRLVPKIGVNIRLVRIHF